MDFKIKEIERDEIPQKGRKVKKVTNIIEKGNYVEKFYNNAEKKIPLGILDEIREIDFNTIPKGEPTPTNEKLSSVLKNLNWTNERKYTAVGSFFLDHFKNGIGLEREFRTIRDLVFDTMKLQLGHVLGKLSAGIIITYDEMVDVKGGNNPSLQELDRKIEEFRNVINFTVPLLVIGLKK